MHPLYEFLDEAFEQSALVLIKTKGGKDYIGLINYIDLEYIHLYPPKTSPEGELVRRNDGKILANRQHISAKIRIADIDTASTIDRLSDNKSIST